MNDSYLAPTGPREASGSVARQSRPAGWLVLAGDAEVTVAMDTSSVIPLAGGRYGAWLRLVPVVVPAESDLPLPRWCEEEMVVFDVAGRRIGSEAAAAWQPGRMTRLESQWREKVLSERTRALKTWQGE